MAFILFTVWWSLYFRKSWICRLDTSCHGNGFSGVPFNNCQACGCVSRQKCMPQLLLPSSRTRLLLYGSCIVFCYFSVDELCRCMCRRFQDSHCPSLTRAGISGTRNVRAISMSARLSLTAICWHFAGSVVMVVVALTVWALLMYFIIQTTQIEKSNKNIFVCTPCFKKNIHSYYWL